VRVEDQTPVLVVVDLLPELADLIAADVVDVDDAAYRLAL
jgi:hypothetical protein